MFRAIIAFCALLSLGACSSKHWTRVYPSPDAAYMGPPRTQPFAFPPMPQPAQTFARPVYGPTNFGPTSQVVQVEEHAEKLAGADPYMPRELRDMVPCQLRYTDGYIHFVNQRICQAGFGQIRWGYQGPGICYSYGKVANLAICWEALLREEEAKRAYGLLNVDGQ